MLFIGILKKVDEREDLDLKRIALYASGEEITKATFNKMKIGAELFPLVKLEADAVLIDAAEAVV